MTNLTILSQAASLTNDLAQTEATFNIGTSDADLGNSLCSHY